MRHGGAGWRGAEEARAAPEGARGLAASATSGAQAASSGGSGGGGGRGDDAAGVGGAAWSPIRSALSMAYLMRLQADAQVAVPPERLRAAAALPSRLSPRASDQHGVGPASLSVQSLQGNLDAPPAERPSDIGPPHQPRATDAIDAGAAVGQRPARLPRLISGEEAAAAVAQSADARSPAPSADDRPDTDEAPAPWRGGESSAGGGPEPGARARAEGDRECEAEGADGAAASDELHAGARSAPAEQPATPLLRERGDAATGGPAATENGVPVGSGSPARAQVAEPASAREGQPAEGTIARDSGVAPTEAGADGDVPAGPPPVPPRLASEPEPMRRVVPGAAPRLPRSAVFSAELVMVANLLALAIAGGFGVSVTRVWDSLPSSRGLSTLALSGAIPYVAEPFERASGLAFAREVPLSDLAPAWAAGVEPYVWATSLADLAAEPEFAVSALNGKGTLRGDRDGVWVAPLRMPAPLLWRITLSLLTDDTLQQWRRMRYLHFPAVTATGDLVQARLHWRKLDSALAGASGAAEADDGLDAEPAGPEAGGSALVRVARRSARSRQRRLLAARTNSQLLPGGAAPLGRCRAECRDATANCWGGARLCGFAGPGGIRQEAAALGSLEVVVVPLARADQLDGLVTSSSVMGVVLNATHCIRTARVTAHGWEQNVVPLYDQPSTFSMRSSCNEAADKAARHGLVPPLPAQEPLAEQPPANRTHSRPDSFCEASLSIISEPKSVFMCDGAKLEGAPRAWGRTTNLTAPACAFGQEARKQAPCLESGLGNGPTSPADSLALFGVDAEQSFAGADLTRPILAPLLDAHLHALPPHAHAPDNQRRSRFAPAFTVTRSTRRTLLARIARQRVALGPMPHQPGAAPLLAAAPLSNTTALASSGGLLAGELPSIPLAPNATLAANGRSWGGLGPARRAEAALGSLVAAGRLTAAAMPLSDPTLLSAWQTLAHSAEVRELAAGLLALGRERLTWLRQRVASEGVWATGRRLAAIAAVSLQSGRLGDDAAALLGPLARLAAGQGSWGSRRGPRSTGHWVAPGPALRSLPRCFRAG